MCWQDVLQFSKPELKEQIDGEEWRVQRPRDVIHQLDLLPTTHSCTTSCVQTVQIHCNTCISDQTMQADRWRLQASQWPNQVSMSVRIITHSHNHTHIFCRGVAGVRVLIQLKNGNCISRADLCRGAKSLKLQLASHNPLPSQHLGESLGPWQEVIGAEVEWNKTGVAGEGRKWRKMQGRKC